MTSTKSLTALLTVGNHVCTDLPEFFRHLAALPKEVRGEVFQQKIEWLAELHERLDEVSESFVRFKEKDAELAPYINEESESWLKVKSAAQRAEDSRKQIEHAQKKIFSIWGEATVTKDFAHLMSAGYNTWSSLRKLAMQQNDYAIAIGIIRRAVYWRLRNPTYGRAKDMVPNGSDFRRITSGQINTIISRNELLSAGYNIASNGWLVAIPSVTGIQEQNDSQSQTVTDVEERTSVSDVDIALWSPIEGEEDCIPGRPLTRSRAAALLAPPATPESLDVIDANEDAEVEISDGPAQKKRKIGHEEEEYDADTTTTDNAASKQRCICDSSIPKTFLEKLGRRKKCDAFQQANLMKTWYKMRNKMFCFDHLRDLAVIVGFQVKRLNHDLLDTRLRQYHEHMVAGTLGAWKTGKDTYAFFRVEARPPRPSDKLGPYRFAPRELSPLAITSEQQQELCSYLGINKTEWDMNGSIVADCFMWWKTLRYNGNQSPTCDSIMEVINREFDMYRFHLREINGRPNYGWLRNIFYSLNQQVIR